VGSAAKNIAVMTNQATGDHEKLVGVAGTKPLSFYPTAAG
jgi:hypothetical protein